jgi:ribonuclease BN (tRNA processing enzyme)
MNGAACAPDLPHGGSWRDGGEAQRRRVARPFAMTGSSAVCISGDTAQSANLVAVCKRADVIVHDALQPHMVKDFEAALAARCNADTAKIFAGI